jgi:DNA-binding CsgD family transcriptional regulator
MRGDDLLATIEAIHAAGLAEGCWPHALELITGTLDGVGATFEVIDKKRRAHSACYFFGLPQPHQVEYADHYLSINPRLAAGLASTAGHIAWDYQVLDEAGMRRDPFYADFLSRLGLRYFVAGTVRHSDDEFAVLAVQRAAKRGHIGNREITLMRQFVPHLRQAFDVARRLKHVGDIRGSLERTLDWLADGVALVRADGMAIYTNESFQVIARRDDGLRLRRGMIEFADAAARDKFNAAVASALRLKAGEPNHASAADFIAARSAGRQPYLVLVRPLIGKPGPRQPAQAAAIVFVRDPLARSSAAIGALRDLFGFTEAEAALAQALQSGMALREYARRHSLSLNTVYTHLRRLREKSGCNRMAELIHRLNELRLPLRLD